MKNTLQKIVLGAVLTAAGIGLTSCYSAKNDIYSKIDAHPSCPSKACEELKGIYKSINLNNLSKEESEILKLNKAERKKEVDMFQSFYPSNFVDSNNVSDKDLIFIYRWGKRINYP